VLQPQLALQEPQALAQRALLVLQVLVPALLAQVLLARLVLALARQAIPALKQMTRKAM
jgi:hypothetical protein